MDVSVVVVTYRRLKSIDRILSAWLEQTPDVWLCDCSGSGHKTNLPITILKASPDPGNKIRHAAATMTTGDIVIKADDDIIPFPGLVNEFITYMEKYGPAILSVHGRTFSGPRYYSNTTLYGSKGICSGQYGGPKDKPVEVDFVGVTTCSPREYLPMDLRECKTEIEDLFWQMEKYRNVKKYVIPTVNYTNLPESKDELRLCRPKSESRIVRQAYYEKWYEANYANSSNNK